MPQTTCADVVAPLEKALTITAREWREAARQNHGAFAERTPLADWSRHFACSFLPEIEFGSLQSAGRTHPIAVTAPAGPRR